METVILVFNKNKDAMSLPFAEQVKAFTDMGKAMEHAVSIGYEDPFKMGVNATPGRKTMIMAGDLHIEILPLLVSK